MRIISLNIWGGIAYEPLLEFVKQAASETDVFCFQEVHNADWTGLIEYDGKHTDMFTQLSKLLPDHTGHFGYNHDSVDNVLRAPSGGAIFIRKNIQVKSSGLIPTYRAKNDADPNGDQNLQYAVLDLRVGPLLIAHFQGMARPGTKLDTDDRLKQSQVIVGFLANHPGRQILCGDFNLMPETESIRMIERAGLRNLITEFKITTTRSELNYARYPNDIQYFADYTLVSPDIQVIDFQVPQINVSDHLPMILEFE